MNPNIKTSHSIAILGMCLFLTLVFIAQTTSQFDIVFKPIQPRTQLAQVAGNNSISFVQATDVVDYYGSRNNTVIKALNQNVTTGNLIIVYVSWGSSTKTLDNITDSCGNNYTIVSSTLIQHGSSAEVAYAKNVIGGSPCIVTATFSADENVKAMIIHEISGADVNSPLDGNTAFYTQGGVGVDINLNTFSTSNNGDYIFGAMISPSQNGTAVTAGDNFTRRIFDQGGYSANLTSEDQIQDSASASTKVSFSVSSFTDALVIGLAFKPAINNNSISTSQNNTDSSSNTTSNSQTGSTQSQTQTQTTEQNTPPIQTINNPIVLTNPPITNSNQVIPDDRKLDWSLAGVIQSNGINKGIPTNFLDCTISITSADSIQTAINDCPDYTVVNIPAGTYNLSTGLNIAHPIVIRGAGPGKTILIPANTILFSPYKGGSPYLLSVVDWTDGLNKGSTSITLSSVTGLIVGQTIVLDQLNDPDLVSVVGNSGSLPSGRNGTSFYGGNSRAQQQVVKVIGPGTKGGPVTSHTILIDNPVDFSPKASLSPQVFWWPGGNMEYAGIENMTVSGQSLNVPYNPSLIVFNFCTNCWVKGVETTDSLRSAINIGYHSYRNEVRDNFVHGTRGTGPTRYGIEIGATSATLIENNILYMSGGIVSTAPISGNVFGYNYIYTTPTAWMGAGIEPHIVHAYASLMEGNVTSMIATDNIWGSGSHDVIFRNRLTGYQDSTAYNNRIALIINAQHKYQTIIGNVLGTSGISTFYEFSNNTKNYVSDRGIYGLGFWSQSWIPNGPSGPDTSTLDTMIRWGNYDYVNNRTQWNTSEIPTGLSLSTSLPASLYLSSKPSWWNNSPWPPIGPDVTRLSNDIPAQTCFKNQNLANGGTFDPSSCYHYFQISSSDTTPPTLFSITTSDITTSGITISWSTTGINSQVLYGLTTTYVSNTSLTSSNSQTLSGLQPNTTYHYKIRSVNGSNLSTNSADQTFTTSSGIGVTPPSVPSGGGSVSYTQSNSNTSSSLNTSLPSNTRPSVSTPSYTFNRYLTVGSTGTDVKALQQSLNSLGYTVSASGVGSSGNETTYYGPSTTLALQKFQCSTLKICSGSPTTNGYGNFGPTTRATLNTKIQMTNVNPQISGQMTNLTNVCPPGLICTPISSASSVNNYQSSTSNNQQTGTKYHFTRSLTVGDTGNDVKQLQIFLNSHPSTSLRTGNTEYPFRIATTGPGSPGNETTYFGNLTAQAVSRFQEYYKSEILTPVNLTRGTGFFGSSTIRKVNALNQ
ncbi:MAG: peptidoglycan-binding protein [Candidatus Paceibacterota bacterium]|jgi:peptidoglycan hydrolase-like protein with peptidoglycan-binding domain